MQLLDQEEKRENLGQLWRDKIRAQVREYRDFPPDDATHADLNQQLVKGMLDLLRVNGNACALVHAAEKLVEKRRKDTNPIRESSVRAAVGLFQEACMQVVFEDAEQRNTHLDNYYIHYVRSQLTEAVELATCQIVREYRLSSFDNRKQKQTGTQE